MTRLARELGISATPVRDALRRLEDDGLVETSARRWTRVAPVSLGVAEETYPILALLERFAVTRAEGRAPGIDEAGEANRLLTAAGADGDIADCVEGDRRFHLALVGLAANAALTESVARLIARISLVAAVRYRQLGAGGSVSRHERILRAVERGDLAAAGEALAEDRADDLGDARRLL